jgi:predicted ATP-dependent endonuclease of OLD family
MQIDFVCIQNYRKLKKCKIDFGEEKIIFVGANNSGKTSAMNALMTFLKINRHKDMLTTDFTLTNWKEINEIANRWLSDPEPNLSLENWQPWVPTVDVWLKVQDNEIHYVSHLIPTLSWTSGKLGIRLIYQPKNIEELFKSYKEAFETAKEINGNSKDTSLNVWPQTMRNYLDKKLHQHFSICSYILDPSKADEEKPQILPITSEIIEKNPFDGLIKIDVINAQRGLYDQSSTENGSEGDRRLSTQLKEYFKKHLNLLDRPESNDIDALKAIEEARKAFDKKMSESFKSSISELEGLNYPGFCDPKIQISSKIDPLESLNHDAVVQFSVFQDEQILDNISTCLPEKYNGLGYQNLISMVFNMIRFRDEWMRVGKADRSSEGFIEPLHLIMIEEPEAHLHPQAQQVFIKKAYDILRNHSELSHSNKFSTQLVISTHSSYIAHEIDFDSLRYFRRTPALSANDVPCAEIVNLKNTFGNTDDTTRFTKRYLKTTHCDLFFADAAILVEGPAERMLVPHFIRSRFLLLDRSYIALLEIGGSHAHRLKPLIDTLGILTLIITDLDSTKKVTDEKVRPEKGKEYRTRNETIKKWIPEKTQLDDVLSLNYEEKINNHKLVRVAHQTEINVDQFSPEAQAIPYTFEDALVLSNINLFKSKKTATGLIKKMFEAVNKKTINDVCDAMFKALSNNSKKAEMALELLLTDDPNKLNPPQYISEGLNWLQTELERKQSDRIPAITPDMSKNV